MGRVTLRSQALATVVGAAVLASGMSGCGGSSTQGGSAGQPGTASGSPSTVRTPSTATGSVPARQRSAKSGSDTQAIAAVFQAIQSSMERGDWTELLSYCTPREAAALNGDLHGMSPSALLKEIAPYHASGIASITVDGDNATLVANEPSGTTNTATFVKTGGVWKLNGNP